MGVDGRTPVLVGAARVTQRAGEGTGPAGLGGAVELMARALRAAADDTGARSPAALLAAVDEVAVPQGTWHLADPGRLVADRVGARSAGTALYQIGVLQQDLLDDACARIASGQVEVAAVVGGEAKHRAALARAAGVEVAEPAEAPGASPGRQVAAASLGVHDLEITRHAVTPAVSYALIDQALAASWGRAPADHAAALGRLWAGLATVARDDPLAWDRRGLDAEAIATPGPGNRAIATPYTKALCSQWNVDQSAALVLCSAGAARRWGVPPDRWVFPRGSACSDHAVPVLQRRHLHRSVGAEVVAARLGELGWVAGGGPAGGAPGPVDVYSCFPAAVEVLAGALGLGLDRGEDLTTTGGLTFGGGPLNNHVLGALAAMVPLLRADPGAVGLSTSVSGFLVKQGAGLWSASPGPAPHRHLDVSAEVAARPDAAPVPVDGGHRGPATVASWTVVAGAGGGPDRAVAVCDVGGGRARTLATSTEPATCRAMATRAWVGEAVEVGPDGLLLLP